MREIHPQSWSDLDHQIWKRRQTWPTAMKKVVVGFSGGLDSLVLLHILKKLSLVWPFELIVAHIHHGDGPTRVWRDECLDFCRSKAESLELKFFERTEEPLRELRSEEELREFRYVSLRQIKDREGCDFIATAHHSDDALETRLLRLLRGTGGQGLKAMRSFDRDLWRPLLETSKNEILNYAQKHGLVPMEDPSNLSRDPLRNWVRHDLLPFVEARQPGLVQNLNRSLQLLTDEHELVLHLPITLVESKDLDQKDSPRSGRGDLIEAVVERKDLLLLSEFERRRLVATVFYHFRVPDYSFGQVTEINKRLDNSQRVHSFIVGGLNWIVDAKQVRIRKGIKT